MSKLARTLLLCSLLGSTSIAHAEFTPGTIIKSLTQNTGIDADGSTHIEVQGGTCIPQGSSTSYYILVGGDAKHGYLLSLAVAAYLSGRTVALGFNPSNCQVISIMLE